MRRLICLAFWLSSGPAGAQPAPEAEAIEAAQAAMIEGRDHLKAGRYEAGIAAYERAYAAFPDVRHLFTIAAAHERTAQACAAGLAAWDRFLDACQGCGDAGAARVRRAALVQRCPVAVALTSDPPAEVTVDGQPRGTTPLSIELAPGDHHLVAEAPGRPPIDTRITVEPGTPATVPLQFAAPVAVPGTPAVGPADNTLAWVAFGVAGASAIASAVFFVQMQGSVDDFDAAESRAAALDARDDADTHAILAQVGLGVAVAAGVGGLLLWESDETAVSVWASPGGLGLSGAW